MTMTDDRMTEHDDLTPWFTAGRDEMGQASGDWLARMEAMALAEQPTPAVAPALGGAGATARGWLREALGQLGGWPAMAGLAAACVTGIWIGAVAPSDWTGSVASDESISAAEPASAYDYAMLGL
ncbi:hypothetical protein [Salipiger aestuarii]|uniref:hypothetical protein n=1 Tax=Salipiger aestuarii TaxID=568098 RepID=UPI00123A4717|nr:hypothetical protein [Salipiger aestuarii]KAA8612099.1 hypothetical protein AL037_08360 [Salipiger aestuarii]